MKQASFGSIVSAQSVLDRLDYIVPRRDVDFGLRSTEQGHNVFTCSNPTDGRYLTLTEYAAQAYATGVQIPMSHWRRIRAKRTDEFDSLALDTLRLLHRDTVRRYPDSNVMMRTVNTNRFHQWQDTSVRALVSDSYLRRDNREFLNVIARHIGADTDVQQYVSSDKHMRIKLLFNGNDDYGHGMYISNSEVGCGAREINGFVWVKVCNNGMIISDASSMISNRTIHRSTRQQVGFLDAPAMETDDEILDQISRQIDKISSPEYFSTLTDQIDLAGNYTLNIEKAKQWFQSQKFAKKDLAEMTARMESEIVAGNGSGDDVSVWGMSQAITNFAHTGGVGYERQHRLERLGYDVVANATQIAELN